MVMRRALFLGIAVSAVLLAVFVARLDWREFALAFRHVAAEWLLGTAVAFFGSVSIRAVRWQIVAGLPWQSFAGVWYSDVVGYVGNAVYPGRAGEVLRIAALHHILHVQPGRAVASAFADRLGDVIVLAFAAIAVATLTINVPAGVIVTAVVFALCALAVFAVFLVYGELFVPVLARPPRWLPGRLMERVHRWYTQSLEHARALRRARILVAALALSIAAVGCDYAIMWFAIQAMGWSLPFAAAVAASVLVAFGTLLPAAPGYVGIYQVACVFALRPFGIAESPALAYSVVVQVTVLTTLAALALIAFAQYGWSFKSLRLRAGRGR
jgi:glycosyltransferase 2 family protein